MTWYLTLQEAWRNLMIHRLRSLLAVLSILIGAASIVALLSIGTLAKNKTLSDFQRLGTDLMRIELINNNRNLQNGPPTFLTMKQWRQLLSPSVLNIAPYGLLSSQLFFHSLPLNNTVIVADPALFTLLHTELARGRYFSYLDHATNYCVLGADVALPTPQVIGQLIRLQNVFFTVVGVLKPWQGNAFFNNPLNSTLFISYPAATKLPVYSALNSALLTLKPGSPLYNNQALLSQKITALNPQLNINIQSAQALQRTLAQQKKTLMLMLGSMGSIALCVGGIGIMNLMLVSVNERKKEIGLRLAIGARRRHIRALFLTEAAILGSVGGFSGCLLGIGLTALVSFFSHWPFSLEWTPILLGLTMAIGTSIFFGFYPAHQAARLNPITVLRAD